MSRALLEVPQLTHQVARRSACNARHGTESNQLGPMTHAARSCLSAAARDDQRSLVDAARRDVGNETRARVAQLEAIGIFGRLDDAVADRLRFAARPREEDVAA